MSLISIDMFAPVFSSFRKRKIGYVQMYGNAGDQLIHHAATQLAIHFQVALVYLKPDDMGNLYVPADVEELVISGGGNMGKFYLPCYELRQQALGFGMPVTVLPQSFTDCDEDANTYKKIFVREKSSMHCVDDAELAPDLALGLLHYEEMKLPVYEFGVFLREDEEGIFTDRALSLVDPAELFLSALDYLSFASLFAEIYTDRLHFAIAGLITGRRVTLLPNSYHKNRSMYETWLDGIGCHWAEDLEGIDYDRDEVTSSLWKHLPDPLAEDLSWESVLQKVDAFDLVANNDELQVLNGDGTTVAKLDQMAQVIWSLCDGTRSLEETVTEVAQAYPGQELAIAADVQRVSNQLMNTGVLSRAAFKVGKKYFGPSVSREPLLISVAPDQVYEEWVYRSASVKAFDRPEIQLWFSIPQNNRDWLSDLADCFVLAMLIEAMRHNRPIEVSNAQVSGSLLTNLDEFQKTWADKRKDFSVIGIDAEVNDAAPTGSGSVLAFSGGLDSCYTLQRCRTKQSDTANSLQAAVMVHGFDIPLLDRQGFQGAFERASHITKDAGVTLFPMRTNLRVLEGNWDVYFTGATAAALSLLASRFETGIISSTMPDSMPLFWHSNPVTDPLLGSDNFKIAHFGSDATRLEKFKAIANWPAALHHLRVCWKGAHRYENCGTCRKCVLTRLSLRCLGLPESCFNQPMTDQELAERIPEKYPGGLDRFDLLDLARLARKRKLTQPWAKKLLDLY